MSLLSFTKKITGQVTPKEKGKKSPVKSAAPTKAAPKSAPAPKNTSSLIGRLGLRPLITEKTVSQNGGANVVAFRAQPGVSKGQVREAIKLHYGITPVSVRTMQMMPKRRVRAQTVGRTTAWKKVYVTLPAGKTIDFTA